MKKKKKKKAIWEGEHTYTLAYNEQEDLAAERHSLRVT